MSDAVYIYGDANGSTYLQAKDQVGDVDLGTYSGSVERRTHWDPRFEIKGIAGCVQVGVIPASPRSTDDGGIWDPDDGQFLTLSRDGINRAIVALREARDAMYGRDQ